MADALSRKFEEPNEVLISEFYAVSSPVLNFVEQLRLFYETNSEGQALLTKWQQDPHMREHFHLRNGLLYFGERLFIPTECRLQNAILTEFHSSPLGGHSGIRATLARIAASFYWPSMRKITTEFVNECQICQQHKASTHVPAGLLQPLPVPSQV